MRSLLLSGLVAAAALMAPATAQACSCAGFEDPEEQAASVLENSDGAFIGVLKSVRDVPDSGPFGELSLTFRVRDAFGVRLNRTVKIRTQEQSSACGLSGRIGRKYALGISGKPGKWASNSCAVMSLRALRAVAGDGVELTSGSTASGCAAA